MSSNSSFKVAVITGAARGIGLAIAQRFHAEKYQVVVLDNDKTTLQTCKTALKDQKRYSFYLCDVSNPKQVQATFQKITTQFPATDALMNNTGIAIFKLAEEATYINGQIIAVDGSFDAAGVGLPSLRE